MSTSTTIAGHQCRPSTLLARSRAHSTPTGTVVTCPCGKRWQVTKHHYTGQHGRRGAICGCGWRLLDEVQEQAA